MTKKADKESLERYYSTGGSTSGESDEVCRGCAEDLLLANTVCYRISPCGGVLYFLCIPCGDVLWSGRERGEVFLEGLEVLTFTDLADADYTWIGERGTQLFRAMMSEESPSARFRW